MIVIAGLILAFVLLLIFGRRGTRNCRWRADRAGDRDGLALYRCAFCGAETLTATGKPPVICLAPGTDPGNDPGGPHDRTR